MFDRSLDLRLQALGRCFITIRAKRMQGVRVVLTLLLQSFAFDLLLGPSVLALRAATRPELRRVPVRFDIVGV